MAAVAFEPSRFGQREQEIGLIEKSERGQPCRFGRGADAGEVDVGGDVLLARRHQPWR